jgi:hypothetical protein
MSMFVQYTHFTVSLAQKSTRISWYSYTGNAEENSSEYRQLSVDFVSEVPGIIPTKKSTKNMKFVRYGPSWSDTDPDTGS